MGKRERRIGLRRALLPGAIAALVSACSASSPPASTPRAVETFASVMAAVRGPDPRGLDKVEALADLGRAVAGDVAPLVTAADIVDRFSGLFYFSRLAEKADIDVVAKGLDDPDLGDRLTAAATLLRLGDRRGVPLLEQARTSDKVLSFSKPPQLVRDYATEALALASLTVDERWTAGPGGIRGFALPASRPLGDVVVTRTGDTIHVTVRMQFNGPGATQALVDQWVRTAKQVWNGKHGSSCCTVALDFDTLLHGTPDRPGYVQVNVLQLPAGARERAYVIRIGATTTAESLGGKGRDEELQMRLASKDNGYVFAHEMGHVLGVADEYHETKDGGSGLEPVAVDDLLSGRGPDLMGQTWPTNGVFPVVQARHVETMLKQYNVPPPVAVATTAAPTAPASATATATSSATPGASPTEAARTSPPPTTAPSTIAPPTMAPTAAPATTAPPTTAPAEPPPTTAPPRTPGPTPVATTAPPPTAAPTLTATIAPARDLTGTWRGGIASTGHYQGQINCKWTGSATLQLTQTGSALSGQAQLVFQTSQAVLAGADCTAGSEQYGVTGTVSSSSVTFQFTGGQGGWYGTARGSFTTDLMSATFAGSGDDYGTGCIQLSRAGVGALPSCAQ